MKPTVTILLIAASIGIINEPVDKTIGKQNDETIKPGTTTDFYQQFPGSKQDYFFLEPTNPTKINYEKSYSWPCCNPGRIY